MLENLTPFILQSFFPLLFIELILIFSLFRRKFQGSTKLVWYSTGVGIIVGVIVVLISIYTLFKGNFLAPISAFILAPLFGGLAAIIVFILGLIFSLFSKNKISVSKGAYAKSSNIRILSTLIIACLLLSEGLVLKEITRLKKVYGNIMDVGGPLTETQIRKAYNNIIFRNHNLFLRGLLIRKNVPIDIIEDIFENTTDKNVIDAVLANPNVPDYIKEAKVEKEIERSHYTITNKGTSLLPVDLIHKKSLIKTVAHKYKILPDLMEYELAKKSCLNLGDNWKLPTPEELLLLLPILENEKILLNKKNEGIKTNNPNIVVSLLPLERKAKPKYRNRVVCVTDTRKYKPLVSQEFKQLPILANWFDAYDACKEYNRKSNLLTIQEWKLILPKIPNNIKGYAWTRTGHKENWYASESKPDSVFYVDLSDKKLKKLHKYSLHEKRFFVFCKEN